MTIEEILSIEDENKRMERFRSYNEKGTMTPYQKMKFISSLGNEKYILEFLADKICFDINTFTYAFVGNFSDELKERVVFASELGWLRDKVSKSNMSNDNVKEIIYALNGNRDKVFRLIDRNMPYYKENENFIIRNVTTSYDENAIDYLLKLEKINPVERPQIKARLKELFGVNEEILQDVNFRLLTDKYKRLGKKITVLSRYPEIQKRILDLTNKELAFLCDSIDYMKSMKIDWIPLVDDLLLNIKEYSNIINNDIGFSYYMRTLKNDETKKQSFLKVLSVVTDKNKYKFKSFKDILNGNRTDRINEIVDDEYFKLTDVDKMKALIFEKLFGQDFKTAKRFNEYYTQDYENAIKAANWSDREIAEYLVKSEGITARNPEFQERLKAIKEANQMVKKYIEFSHTIFECDDIAQLKTLFENIKKDDEINIPNSVLDSNFRAFYARLMNKELYVPSEKDKISINGKDAYLMPPDAMFLLTSTEAYARGNDGKTVVQDWNSKKIKNHVICCVLSGGKNLSLPPINGVNYGLAPVDQRAILKSAPHDTGVWPIARDFDVYKSEAKYAFGAKFVTPLQQLKEVMRRHGEVDVERESYSYEDDSIFKIQPNYTISIVEPPLSSYFKKDFKKSDLLDSAKLAELIDWGKMDDISYRTNVISDQLKDDPRWAKTIKDSEKKGIKRTIVDMTHDLLIQRVENDKIEKKILSYTEADLKNPDKMQEFLKLLEDMIVDFDAARSATIHREIKGWAKDGSSVYGKLIHEELHDTIFSTKVMDRKLWKIEEKVKKCDPDIYKAFMTKMKAISKLQVDKLDKQYWWYEKDTSHDWWDYYKYASRQLSGITYKDEKSIIKNLLDQNMNGTSIQGGVAVKKTIEEIAQLREYDIPKGEPDWHGRRHINNVVLFSYLIAQHEGKLKGQNMEILLQAAKYHDVGRDGNWNGLGDGKRHDEDVVPHAYPSALAAEFYMKKELKSDGSRKYTDAQIAMVKVAIEYHEVHEKEKNKFNTEIFESLCQKEGVRAEDYDAAKLICIYLKDADALDRTRFMYNHKNAKNHMYFSDGLDMRYLRTDTAVALRDLSRSINNQHYNNRSGKLYIPEILNPYNAVAAMPTEPWDVRKRQIYEFLSTHSINFDPSNPSRITKNDLQKLMKIPEEKGLFCKVRSMFKKFIENIRNRAKDSGNREDDSDDREVL